jgi:hypothetical protein
MRKLVLLSFLILSGVAFSQENGTVKGTILDAEMDGQPMLLAHIDVKNTSIGGETNLHGNFEFTSIEPGAYVLVLSYPGYQELEIPVVIEQNNTTVVNGIMKAYEIVPKRASAQKNAVSRLPGGNAGSDDSASLQ